MLEKDGVSVWLNGQFTSIKLMDRGKRLSCEIEKIYSGCVLISEDSLAHMHDMLHDISS